MSLIATGSKVGMVALLGASIPTTESPSELWLQWGLAGVVVAFVMWRDHHRERRMTAVIERQEAWMRDTLIRALTQNTAALQEVTITLRASRMGPPLVPPPSSPKDLQS